MKYTLYMQGITNVINHTVFLPAVDTGLGGGAIFGIIVGVLALVVLIGAAAWFVIIPYARNNNLLDNLPFVSSSSTPQSSSSGTSGFENSNYETSQPYTHYKNEPEYDNTNEFAPSSVDTPSNGSVD